VFHDTLSQNQNDLTSAIISRIDSDYDVTNTEDPEVLQRWFPLTIRLKTYTAVYDPAEAWVGSLGRLKYLTPVYTALEESNQHNKAVSWLNENEDFYCPITYN